MVKKILFILLISMPISVGRDSYTESFIERFSENGGINPRENGDYIYINRGKSFLRIEISNFIGVVKGKSGKISDKWTISGDICNRFVYNKDVFSANDESMISIYERGKDGCDVLFVKGGECIAIWNPFGLYVSLITEGNKKSAAKIEPALEMLISLSKVIPDIRQEMCYVLRCKEFENFKFFKAEVERMAGLIRAQDPFR